MKNTHFVVKYDDLPLDNKNISEALSILGSLSRLARHSKGKDPYPNYIVINTDESYIEEIIDVLRKHGHWEES